ncbi:hypothetical protein HK099_006647 [Clydaea vesicula]|uniref:Uncharacterized protein n=1 Tax=Clydaea vesicula TaxID=447962 RepID=A0AAD5U9J3_9FUNG|nr:hypothetical protein HK099_006647 [Clydaea vesicula]
MITPSQLTFDKPSDDENDVSFEDTNDREVLSEDESDDEVSDNEVSDIRKEVQHIRSIPTEALRLVNYIQNFLFTKIEFSSGQAILLQDADLDAEDEEDDDYRDDMEENEDDSSCDSSEEMALEEELTDDELVEVVKGATHILSTESEEFLDENRLRGGKIIQNKNTSEKVVEVGKKIKEMMLSDEFEEDEVM